MIISRQPQTTTEIVTWIEKERNEKSGKRKSEQSSYRDNSEGSNNCGNVNGMISCGSKTTNSVSVLRVSS